MKNSSIFVWIFLSLVCWACSKDKNIIIQSLNKKLEFYNIHNTYFSDILDISFYKENYYILDNGTRKILILDKNFNFIKALGGSGKGPGEFIDPHKFIIVDDRIFISDIGKRELIEFNLVDNTSKSQTLPDQYSGINNFTLDADENVYFSSLISKKRLKRIKEGEIENFGIKRDESFNVNQAFHVLFTKNQIMCVAVTTGDIELYDPHNGDKLGNYEIPMTYYQGRLNLKEEKIKKNPNYSNSQFKLNEDVEFFDGKLYILINENIGSNLEFRCNKVLVISVNEDLLKVEKVIELEGVAFKSFTINRLGILAFESETGNLVFFEY